MRRPNGSGTVVKLSGARRRPYAARVSKKDRYGVIVQRAIGYYATAREAYDALDAYNREKLNGTAPAADRLSVTVRQVYEGWSARAYRKISAPAIACYKAAWNRRLSVFGGRRMRDMTLDDWQSVLDGDEERGLSQSLIDKDVTLIKALYAWSMERDIVGKDYSAYLEIPSVGAKKRKDALTEEEIRRLAELAREGFPWADTALMLCYTGFRISEFLSLTPASWHGPEEGLPAGNAGDAGNVANTGNTVYAKDAGSVTNAGNVANNGNAGTVGGMPGYLQGGSKTRAGRNRIVPVHPKIRPYLLDWLEKGGETIISMEGKAVPGNWYRTHAFKPVAEALGEPEATPHWCRHTFATRLHSAGADPLTVKWLLGHSTESDITAHYTHETIAVLNRGILLLT